MVPFRAMRIENMDLINRCLTDSIRYARGCQREMIGAVIAVGIVRVLYEVWQWKKGVKGVERKLLRPFLTSLLRDTGDAPYRHEAGGEPASLSGSPFQAGRNPPDA